MDRNEVALVGRLPEPVQIKSSRSGTGFAVWRLIVRRQQRGRGARVDTIPCVSFEPGVVESALAWLPDDMIEVVGSLRRRWWGGKEAKSSGYEVEVRSAESLGQQAATVPAGGGGDACAPTARGTVQPPLRRSRPSTGPAARDPAGGDPGEDGSPGPRGSAPLIPAGPAGSAPLRPAPGRVSRG
ncbi:hypothetical protein GCM10010466_59540 [Planomonospora alba]|uniref:Single-stranded DNA-binding protein n=1 Tax=Planomonospora alba TaxID=161354 RepID=A0ABP6NZ80_9ACTN